MFSRRSKWDAATNRLTEARRERALRGEEILDLTQSNPTTAAIGYPVDELSDALGHAARAQYSPAPLGILSAREAVAREWRCAADEIVLAASTSEAYSWLFKLLTDPGDEVLTATPAYPLLEHLSQLEVVSLRTFPLELHGRWHCHAARAHETLTARTRAIVVVNPNNPTGSYLRPDEQTELAGLGVPIISDEVFYDYPIAEPIGPSLSRTDTLTFTLGGLSKSAGLPHYKLAWIRVNGPDRQRRDALRALELIADSYLSVSTPVQVALPDLLRIAPTIRNAIRERCRGNLDSLHSLIGAGSGAAVLPVEGGWSAVLRIPSLESDEEFALRLLKERGVIVHPGYFFDFESDGFLVISLLTQPEILRDGVRRIVDRIAA